MMVPATKRYLIGFKGNDGTVSGYWRQAEKNRQNAYQIKPHAWQCHERYTLAGAEPDHALLRQQSMEHLPNHTRRNSFRSADHPDFSGDFVGAPMSSRRS